MICYSNNITKDYVDNFKGRCALVPLICSGCNQHFEKPRFRCLAALKNHRGLYCNATCYSSNIAKSKPNTICHVCAQSFYAKAKRLKNTKSGYLFCSQICANQFLGKALKKEANCISCNKIIKSNKKYCNNQCQINYNWRQYKQKIEHNGGFEKESREMTRKYLIEKYGNICSICRTTDWFGQAVPLVCDHIDGNSNNNKLTNLRMVCANCNQLLPTFGIKNKGNGRKFKQIK